MSTRPPVAVVTGSTSGIGRATAISLARLGYSVLVHGRKNLGGAEETCSAIEAVHREARHLDEPEKGARQDLEVARYFLADISDGTAVQQLVYEAFRWHGGVDAWVHCAGADVITAEFKSLTYEEKLEKLWRVDVEGVIRLSRLVAMRMLSQPPGASSPAMVFVGWDQAKSGVEGDSGELFCTTKSAVEAFSKSLAKTVAPDIRVNSVLPGWIRTGWGEQALAAWQERAIGESQLGRWGNAEDVANAIAFLCSAQASFVHGESIAVNGGWQGMATAPKCPSSIRD